MAIKVLIADDQFPSEREEENESTKQELIRLKGDELKAKGGSTTTGEDNWGQPCMT